jgi:hypothetical protein
MALNKSANAGTIFLSVANGKLVRQHKEATPQTTQRVTKTGKVVHEEFFNDLIGVITNITTKENDYGKQWVVTFMDGNDIYFVTMPYSSRYSSSFLKALPNLNRNNPVRFLPWEMQDKNDASKKITGITLYQDDGNGFVKIKPFFTKETPNGLPEMKRIKVKGKEIWDDSDMMQFLERIVVTWVSKKINKEIEGAPF